MQKISLVIRCYNEEEHIGRLLSGVMEQTVKDIDIIVVDSGSTDATKAIASRYPVKLISINSDDFSFGYALNVGCNEAIGDIIVIASAHVYPVYTDWLEKMIEPFNDTSVALVYGNQKGNEVTKYSEHQVMKKWFPEKSIQKQKHPFCNNANAAIRRKTWKKIRYNEELTGLEDLDWAKRVQTAGYSIAYQADAEIVHVHDESAASIYNRYKRESFALKQIMPEEQFGVFDFVKLFVGNVASDWYHAWHDGVIWGNIKSTFIFRLMQFLGTYRGFSMSDALSNSMKHAFYYPNERIRNESTTHERVNQRDRVNYSSVKMEDEN